jgi:Ribonuclease HI
MSQIIIYGSSCCGFNEDTGEWKAALTYNGSRKIIAGSEPGASKNRMEILSCLAAMNAVKKNSIPVLVVSSNPYFLKSVTSWLNRWAGRRWVTLENKPIENKELWWEYIVSEFWFKKIKYAYKERIEQNAV